MFDLRTSTSAQRRVWNLSSLDTYYSLGLYREFGGLRLIKGTLLLGTGGDGTIEEDKIDTKENICDGGFQDLY